MKNRTKTISLLLAVCLMITLLPAVALAEGEDTVSVSIAGRPLNSSTPYYINGAINGEDVGVGSTHANVSDDNWNAYFDSSANTLTLKNIKYNTWTGATPLEVTGTGTTLTIILEGNNILEVGPDKSAISASGKTIVIQGSGSLTAYSSNSGNGITGNVTVSGGSLTAYSSLGGNGITGNVTVSSGSLTAYSGNSGNGITGNVTVSGGSLTAYSSLGGNGITGNVTVSGGSLIAYSVFASGIGSTINLSPSFNAEVKVGSDSSDAVVTSFTSGGKLPDKYVSIGIGGGTSGGTTPTPTPKTYSISFNRNTQDPAATGTMEAQTFIEGEPQAIKANEFSVPGYVFKGWNTEQKGGGISYADEQVITLNEGIMKGLSGFSLY